MTDRQFTWAFLGSLNAVSTTLPALLVWGALDAAEADTRFACLLNAPLFGLVAVVLAGISITVLREDYADAALATPLANAGVVS